MRTAQIGPDLRLALTGIIGGQGKRGFGGVALLSVSMIKLFTLHNLNYLSFQDLTKRKYND